MKLYGFEMPGVFSKIAAHLTSPPRVGIVEARSTDAALNCPQLQFYDPASLKFPNAMKPVIPDTGGQITMGLGMVTYDGQPIFDRNVDPGPVREFFRGVREDNRIKSQ